MAKRRMFSLDVVDTDRFINMSQKARYLYYELGLRADDDGFVGAPLKIARMIECTSTNLEELINNDFLIQFKSGVIAITEWRRNNSIRKDMYRATIYKEEYSELVEVDGVYIVNQPNNVTEHVTENVTEHVTENVTENVTKNDYVTSDVTCNVTLGKDRLDKGSIKNHIVEIEKQNSTMHEEIIKYLNEKAKTNYRYSSKSTQKHINARFNEGYGLSDFKNVIDVKVAEWKENEMSKYLRPETLFGTKFENYLNQSSEINKMPYKAYQLSDYDVPKCKEDIFASGGS